MLIACAAILLTNPQFTQRLDWESADPESVPAPREHAALFLDEARHRAILYAGSGYAPQMAPLADAWALDLQTHTWSTLTVQGDAPTGGSIRVAQPTHADHAYTFGGYDGTFTTNNDLHRVTFTDDALVFTAVTQHNPPPDRALHAFAFDAESSRFVVTTGVSRTAVYDDTILGTLNDDGSVTWTALNPPAHPSDRFGAAFGFDDTTGTLLLVSGQAPPTQEAPMAMTADAWALNLRANDPTWSRVELPESYEGRRNPCFAFNPDSRTLYIWGGTADARTSIPGLNALTPTPNGWTLTTHPDDTNANPPRRSSGFGFTDPTTHHTWLGFGNSATTRHIDFNEVTPKSD